MIIENVSERQVGKFWCYHCAKDREGEHWTVSYCTGREISGDTADLCRGCMINMINKLLGALCP